MDTETFTVLSSTTASVCGQEPVVTLSVGYGGGLRWALTARFPLRHFMSGRHDPVYPGPAFDPATKFLSSTLRSREDTAQLEGLLRETLYQALRDELLSNAQYAFADKDAAVTRTASAGP